MNKRFTKKDFILVFVILIIAVICYLFNILSDTKDGKQIVIHVNGSVVHTCPLDNNNTIEINGGSNILTISDGKAYMSEADCPDHICINQGSIYRNKESIICLPNKVVVEVVDSKVGNFLFENSSDDDIDVIAK